MSLPSGRYSCQPSLSAGFPVASYLPVNLAAATRYCSFPVCGQRLRTTWSPAAAGLLVVSLPSPAITVTITSPGFAGRASTSFVLRAVCRRPFFCACAISATISSADLCGAPAAIAIVVITIDASTAAESARAVAVISSSGREVLQRRVGEQRFQLRELLLRAVLHPLR